MTTIEAQLKKAAIIIPQTHLVLQEFLALVAGIKPVISFSIPQEEIKLIKNNFPSLHIVRRDKNIWHRQMNICSISYNKLLAQKTLDAFCGKAVAFDSMGTLLGYPKCCTTKWVEYTHIEQQHDATSVTYGAYKATTKFSCFTNNLLNFSTRVGDNNVKDFRNYINLNKHLVIPYHYYQFISHVPCRYDCPESIKMGKAIDALMKEYAPRVEKMVKYTLSKPILFFDLFKLVIFDGYVENNILYYKKIIPPFFLIEPNILTAIKIGNKITVDSSHIEISKDTVSLLIYKKQNEADGFLLNFGEE